MTQANKYDAQLAAVMVAVTLRMWQEIASGHWAARHEW